MTGSKATRVLLVVATFTFGVVYASYCSTACALEGLPQATQHSEDHGSPPGHSQDSHDDGSGDSGCVAADHFAAYVPAAPGMVQREFTNVDRVNVTVPGAPRIGTSSSIMSSFWLSGLAPPPKLKTPVYDQISVLRI
jgi:hypothetical protein